MVAISKSEQSYIQAAILSEPPQRADGRGLLDYRSIALQIGGDVAPLANGSARANVGGTEVVAAVKLEVEEVGYGGDGGMGQDGGRVTCAITCSSSAYPSHQPSQLDDLSSDLTSILSNALSSALTPSPQLTIVPQKKSWLLSIEALVLSDSGNVIDALLIAIRAALWDLRIPRTRGVEFQPTRVEVGVDNEEPGVVMKDILKEKKREDPVDFELQDYWDDGEPLWNRESLPVSITLHLITPLHFLDATSLETESTSLRLVLFFSFSDSPKLKQITNPIKPKTLAYSTLHGTRLLGAGELPYKQLKTLISDGETYGRKLALSLNVMLTAEDAKEGVAAAAFR